MSEKKKSNKAAPKMNFSFQAQVLWLNETSQIMPAIATKEIFYWDKTPFDRSKGRDGQFPYMCRLKADC